MFLFPLTIALLYQLDFALSALVQSSIIDETFDDYVTTYGKDYTTTEADAAKAAISDRMDQINAANAKYSTGDITFQEGLNEYSDLSPTDFNNQLNSFTVVLLIPKSLPETVLNAITIPPTLNYTAMGYTTSVRNQGLCGSCWTFSATGVLEAQFFKKNNLLVKLSEQFLIDCNKNYANGNFGCNGGNMLLAYDYIVTNVGIPKSANYPYRGADTFPCTYNAAYSVGTILSHDLLPAGNETHMLLHLIAVGPLSIAIDASLASFQNYASGIYSDPACTNTLNHAMLLTGYGTDTTQSPPVDFWIVKNSYGTTWGERGYIRIKRGVNMCGIADYVNYALVV